MTTKQREVTDFIGMNKGSHEASVCWIHEGKHGSEVEIYIKERFSRKKRDGYSVLPILSMINEKFALNAETTEIGENEFGTRPLFGTEAIFNEKWPYFDAVKLAGFERFSAYYNAKLRFIPHHLSHAYGSAAISPFRKSIIVVSDGMGNMDHAFDPRDTERLKFPAPTPDFPNQIVAESVTAYIQNDLELTCVYKEWQKLHPFEDRPGISLSDGLGFFYQTASEFIFGNSFESGKVMGLAPFGEATTVQDRLLYMRELDWSRSFGGGSKQKWEKDPSLKQFQTVAATAQAHFEQTMILLIKKLKENFPEYSNLILTGGCALNCVANTSIGKLGLFENIYVPPFPGDEGISFGVASYLKHNLSRKPWSPIPYPDQLANFGPKSSLPSSREIEEEFKKYTIQYFDDIAAYCAGLLSEGKVIAWFQGRSESGPRALGNRSILADPKKPGIQDYLNRRIKMRESFRPYGASCLFEEARKYFDFPCSIESPHMSYTAQVKETWSQSLAGITHADGTSRFQTVRKSQNPLFHRLIQSFGEISGYFVLLNTSLNVMGEPIVETLKDARKFLENTEVFGLAIENYFVMNPKFKN